MNFLKLCLLVFLLSGCGTGTGDDASDNSNDDQPSPTVQPTVVPTPIPTINTIGLKNYGVIEPGRLSRSAQPTKDGLRHLREAGVTHILKLDTDQEYSLALEKSQFGGPVTYGPVSLDRANCQQGYSLADWIDAQLKSGEWVHVHCWLGKDRAGFVIGSWKLKYGGYTLAQVKADWAKYGQMDSKYIPCLEKLQ